MSKSIQYSYVWKVTETVDKRKLSAKFGNFCMLRNLTNTYVCTHDLARGHSKLECQHIWSTLADSFMADKWPNYYKYFICLSECFFYIYIDLCAELR